MIRWLSIEQSTGIVIEELPDLIVTGTMRKTLGSHESLAVDLPVATAPPEWERATAPDYAALIALDEDIEAPLWGGLVTKSDRATGDSATVAMTLDSAEWYLDQRFVGDVTYTGVEQCTLAQSLVSAYAAPSGLPFQFDVVAGSTLRDRTYRDMDDVTVYTALQNLMGVQGGPEWTVNWAHIPAAGGVPERYVPVLYVRDKITTPRPAGVGPAAEFVYPGNLLSVTESRKHGANDVMATGSSQVDYRPQSAHHVDLSGGGPKFESRWSPSSSITDVGVLDEHAAKALPILKYGQKTLTLIARRRDAEELLSPRLGRDWFLGDDISYDVTDDAWPRGLRDVARCIAWELDEDTVSPILAVDAVEADA